MLLGDPLGITPWILLAKKKSQEQSDGTSSQSIKLNDTASEQEAVAVFVEEQQRRLKMMRDTYLNSFGRQSEEPTAETSTSCVSSSNDIDPLLQAPTCAPNWLPMYACFRRHVYMSHAASLNHMSGNHAFYQLMHWADARNIFIHPALRIRRESTQFRDHRFVTCEPIPKYCPLLAIPESMCVGFADLSEKGKSAPASSLLDEQRAKHFAEATGAGDSDICQFFFDSLSMMVADLLSALHSPNTDARHALAQSLLKVRTMLNAPYLGEDTVFGKEDTALADVLLQMIRNYVAGGPMVGQVDRDVLKWAVSVCLSHSTPLTLGDKNSIGIIPIVHLLPHGGHDSNCVVIARTARKDAGKKMAHFFRQQFGLGFDMFASPAEDLKWVYLVPTRDLSAGEEILTQAMAPVCNRETEASHMWKLSCGVAPEDSMPTATLSALQSQTARTIVSRGSEAAASLTTMS